MSLNPMVNKELVLSSTSPYVDAILTVRWDENGSPPSTDSNNGKGLSTHYNVHRIVLSRLSRFFMQEFKRLEEEKKDEKTTSDLASDEQAFWKLDVQFTGKKEKVYFTLFPSLLDFLYGKPLQTQDSNHSFEFLELASRFQVPKLASVVSDLLLAGITKESCFSLLQKAIEFNASVVQDRCLELVARNFQMLYPAIKHKLNDLPLRAFSALMNHPSLSITSEYRVYKVVRSFYTYQVDEDGVTTLEKSDRLALFSAVRLAHLKYTELEKVIRDEIVPKSLLTEALTHRLTAFERPGNVVSDDLLPLRLRKRSVGRLFEPPYTQKSVGDASSSTTAEVPKGVIYHLATSFGKSEWKNPSLTGSIKVSFSSIEKGKTHNLVDLEPQDCWSMDIPASWVAIDLRQGKLLLSHFTLRHGGSSKMDTLRSWIIQACDNDGDRWVEISRHSNDGSLHGPFGMHTFKVTTEQQRPFRQFRILQNGHNSGNSNFLSLSYIELYGLFFPKSGQS